MARTPSPSDIKFAVRDKSHFFDRKAMKFFGDTMKNFGTYRHTDDTVCLYRKKPVKHNSTGEWIYNEIADSLISCA